MFITRLFPLLAFRPDEPSGGEVPTAETTEAPTADQPEVTTPDVTPEAPEAGTPDAEATDTPETPEDEKFTDVDTDGLPEEVATRYQQMQADYTRKTQALAERQSELDAVTSFASDLLSDTPNDTQEAVFRTLADRLGVNLEGFDEEPVPADGDEPKADEAEPFHDPRLDPILAEREAEAHAKSEAAREAELDAAETQIDDGIAALAKADGIELSEDEQALIFSDVLALPPLADGPNVQAAWNRWKKADQASKDRWVKSKASTQAPTGKPGEEPVDFTDEEQRLAFTVRAVEAAQRAQSGL